LSATGGPQDNAARVKLKIPEPQRLCGFDCHFPALSSYLSDRRLH
jgi:hypothetical protein